jgi:hypothetical protein
VGKGPGGAFVEWRGIYKFDGDDLMLCYKYVKDNGTTRPTSFRTDNTAGTIFMILKLKRDLEK